MAIDVHFAMGMSTELPERCSPGRTELVDRCPAVHSGTTCPWSHLVTRIKADDPSAFRDFRSQVLALIRKSVHRMLSARDSDNILSECVEDSVAEAYMAIRGGNLRDPERLPGFVAAVARSVSYHSSRKFPSWRFVQIKPEDPTLAVNVPGGEDLLVQEEQRKLINDALATLTHVQREIVERFYVCGESPQTIQSALGISDRQFQVEKSRGKRRLVEKCQKALTHKELLVASGVRALAAAVGREK